LRRFQPKNMALGPIVGAGPFLRLPSSIFQTRVAL
jgi:hypothetical protein